MTKHIKIEAGKCTVHSETFSFTFTTFILNFSLKNRSRLLICHRGDHVFVLALCSDSMWCPLLRSGAWCEFVFGCTKTRLSGGENDWDWQGDYLGLLLTIPAQMGPWMCHGRTQTPPSAPPSLGGKHNHPAAENLPECQKKFWFSQNDEIYDVKTQ